MRLARNTWLLIVLATAMIASMSSFDTFSIQRTNPSPGAVGSPADAEHPTPRIRTQIPASAVSAANGSSIPPFAQCPSIGSSPSCGILILVHADRSVAVLGDPAVGPYDGGDDTLVGVQNDSAEPVPAITVSGPTGSAIFGFDGDGICTYVTITCGKTGYESPTTSFKFDPKSLDRGEVDFAKTGVPPHASDYFSLEGALTAAILTARQGPLLQRYVALGDSYSSGEGAIDLAGDPSFISGTDVKNKDECHRSLNAYPELLASQLGVQSNDLVFRACSGALVAGFVKTLPSGGGWNEGPQLDAIAPSGHQDLTVGLVTLSVGGNDDGFGAALSACIHGFGRGRSGCLTQIADRAKKGLQLLQNGGRVLYHFGDHIDDWRFCPQCDPSKANVVDVPSLSALYKEIHKRAPNAEIVVMGYPEIFPSNASASCVVGTFMARNPSSYVLDPDEMTAFDTGERTLNRIVSEQVDLARKNGVPNITYVDTYGAFAGHGPCDTTPPFAQWLNGLMWNGHFISDISPFSFHPDEAGQHNLFFQMFAGL